MDPAFKWFLRKIRYAIFGVLFLGMLFAFVTVAMAGWGEPGWTIMLLPALVTAALLFILVTGTLTLSALGKILERTKDIDRIVKEFERLNHRD